MLGFLSRPPSESASDSDSDQPKQQSQDNAAAGSCVAENQAVQATDLLDERLFCWLLDTTPASLLNGSLAVPDGFLEKLELRLRTLSLDNLPRVSSNLPELNRALDEDRIKRASVCDLILKDPDLATQLLQVANSPMFRPSEKTVETVDQAVFLLGTIGLKRVISTAMMRPAMAARSNEEAEFVKRIWTWALTCGWASELVGQEVRDRGSEFFLPGLLPGLSYLLIRRGLLSLWKEAVSDEEPPSARLQQVIIKRYVADMNEAIARRWSLPPDLILHLRNIGEHGSALRESPIYCGVVLATRETLLHSAQRNLPEEDLRELLPLDAMTFDQVRRQLATMLKNR